MESSSPSSSSPSPLQSLVSAHRWTEVLATLNPLTTASLSTSELLTRAIAALNLLDLATARSDFDKLLSTLEATNDNLTILFRAGLPALDCYARLGLFPQALKLVNKILKRIDPLDTHLLTSYNIVRSAILAKIGYKQRSFLDRTEELDDAAQLYA